MANPSAGITERRFFDDAGWTKVDGEQPMANPSAGSSERRFLHDTGMDHRGWRSADMSNDIFYFWIRVLVGLFGLTLCSSGKERGCVCVLGAGCASPNHHQSLHTTIIHQSSLRRWCSERKEGDEGRNVNGHRTGNSGHSRPCGVRGQGLISQRHPSRSVSP